MSYVVARSYLSLRLIPTRLYRLGKELFRFCPWRIGWWLDLFFLLSDLLFVFDLYELISNAIDRQTRPLTDREEELLRSIYGDSLPYHLVRIDEYARFGPPQGRFCYVSFHTINSWGPMMDPILVHEAMHIWQYCQVGACYIPRALLAQRTEMGYNYGGLKPLTNYPSLRYFNYEQQADIVMDAYSIQVGFRTRWCKGASKADLAIFQPFLEEIQGRELPNGYFKTD